MTDDMRDVMLEAQAEVQDIVREIMLELMKPQVMARVRETWLSAPDEVKEAFKKERPADYAALMDDIKRR